MGIEEAERLQSAIDVALSVAKEHFRIVLDHGSECTELTSAVDLRVFEGTSEEFRLFSIVTARWLHYLLDEGGSHAWEEWPAEQEGLFCTGGPLVVVREVTADAIVRAVRRYLLMEGSSA